MYMVLMEYFKDKNIMSHEHKPEIETKASGKEINCLEMNSGDLYFIILGSTFG